jgi:quinol monooxygenase YgiN
MGFIQLVEFSTTRIDEVRKLSEKYQADTQGKRKVLRGTLCVDRNTPDRYVVVAEFRSPEEAMENSNLPETQAFAKAMDELADGPAAFRDLEVIDSWEG